MPLSDSLSVLVSRGFVIGGLITLGTFIADKARAVSLDGFFINTPNCSLKVYRKEVTGGIDTLYAKTNSRGKWVIETANADPEFAQDETLYVDGGWNLGKNAETFLIQGAARI